MAILTKAASAFSFFGVLASLASHVIGMGGMSLLRVFCTHALAMEGAMRHGRAATPECGVRAVRSNGNPTGLLPDEGLVRTAAEQASCAGARACLHGSPWSHSRELLLVRCVESFHVDGTSLLIDATTPVMGFDDVQKVGQGPVGSCARVQWISVGSSGVLSGQLYPARVGNAPSHRHTDCQTLHAPRN